MEHRANSTYTLDELYTYASTHGYSDEAAALRRYVGLRDSPGRRVSMTRVPRRRRMSQGRQCGPCRDEAAPVAAKP